MLPGRFAFAMSLALAAVLARPASGAVQLDVKTWANNDAGFAAFAQRVSEGIGRNLLARSGVRWFVGPRGGAGDVALLVDGDAGTRGAEGRCFTNGQPTVIAFYLGGPKTIFEVGLFTNNVDSRSNQDFEIRFADNRRHPGEPPTFPVKPDFTSGDTVLGGNGGGVYSRIGDDQGRPLLDYQPDWIEFRLWNTYKTKAGDPARQTDDRGAAVYIELEVFSEPQDVVLPSPEELKHRAAVRAAPKQPPFVKRDTWQETLRASREAVLEWETLQDRLAARNFGLMLGDWHVLGPLPERHPLVRELRQRKEFDFHEKFAPAEGQTLTWQRREALADGQTHAISVPKGQVVFLAREVKLDRPVERKQLDLDLMIDRGSARWLPEGQGAPLTSPVGISRGGREVQLSAGSRQLLLELRPDNDGQCRFYCLAQPAVQRPGAGPAANRIARRHRVWEQVRQEFTTPDAQSEMRWESQDKIWSDSNQREVSDWLPGFADEYLRRQYRAAIPRRIGRLEQSLARPGIPLAAALETLRPQVTAWLGQAKAVATERMPLADLRRHYQGLAGLEDALHDAARLESMRLAVEDHQRLFGDRYPKADQYLRQIAALRRQLHETLVGQVANLPPQSSPGAAQAANLPPQSSPGAAQAANLPPKTGQISNLPHGTALHQAIDAAQQTMLLDTPLLSFEKLLLAKGHGSFASNWSGPNNLGDEIAILSPVRPDGKLTTLLRTRVSDMDLHWNAQRLLFSDGRQLWEINLDGSGLRRVTAEDAPATHYDGCYLPDGRIACVSNACEQAVPCTGQGDVGNIHLIDADGRNERRLTFDQDHDWNPTVLHDGRVLYTRWEYTDLPHYFSRILFRMNPDGTSQQEYYGSNSYWPNALYWPRPIPGHPTQLVCVVSGHHGVSRTGELVLLDPGRGRHEAQGALQKIPGHGLPVEPIIRDNLVGDTWPKFAAPWPLAEPGTHRGAGRYFLVCVQREDHGPWQVCLADVFDNLTPILTGDYMTPIPVVARPQPPVIPSQVDPSRNDATIYVADIYRGEGLRGYPRGSIKALRVGTHHYRYPGNGDTYASSLEGGWDIKRILGTVPVRDDGSALFSVPANTPIFLQPLDAEGKAQQQMRSWYTAMPGEVASCVGCHERQNSVPPGRQSLAAMGRPSPIEPWLGPLRGVSFERDVQPMVDRRCVGCHSDKPCRIGDQEFATLDLRGRQARPADEERYSPAYVALQRYVRRAGYESDGHMHAPAEFDADTSPLVQMLKKGHYGVQLDRTDWERLYTWIDYNIPYPATWRESHRPPRDPQIARRAENQRHYAGIVDRAEEPLPLPPPTAFEPPRPLGPRPAPVTTAGWPLTPPQAQDLKKAGPPDFELPLPGGGVAIKFTWIPAGRFVMGDREGFADEQQQAVVTIDRPFYLSTCEVTNAAFACFDAQHDSAYIEGRGKDRTTRGTPANRPDQPVVRITWRQAMAFCEWLSQVSGRRCTLPSEAQWEWACRAGTATRCSFGEQLPAAQPPANLADETIRNWNYGRGEPGYRDGVPYSGPVGQFPPNAWGLRDMHGNVAEWTRSVYRPYPYNPADGRDDPRAAGLKVVRGGSWNDTLRYATSASRWRYPAYQPVYNVGFRILCEVDKPQQVASRNDER